MASYADAIQQDLERSGMRSIQEPQMMRDRQQATYMGNLGRFAMFAGLGMMQGIGQGLANTDLRNPFRGAGMSLLGGSAIGGEAAGAQMSYDFERMSRMERDEYDRSKRALAEEEDRAKLETYKPAKVFSTKKSKDDEDSGEPGDVSSVPEGMRLGLKSPSLALFGAQQALAQVKQEQALTQAQKIMFGIQDRNRGGR